MKELKEKSLGIALIMQALLYCLQSLLISVVASALGEYAAYTVSCVGAVFVFGLPIVVYIKLSDADPKAIFKLGMTEHRTRNSSKCETAMLFAFAFAMTVTAVNAFGMLTELVMSLLGKEQAQTVPADPVILAFTFIRSVLLAAILEEILFRGAVFDAIDGRKPSVRVVISALLFALMHYNLSQFFYAFAAGAVIALFAYITGSLRFAISVHLAQNLVTFIFSVLSLKLGAGIYATVSLIAFIVFAAVAFFGAIYLIYGAIKRKNTEISAPEKAQNEKMTISTLVLYIVIAALITVLNF